MCKVDAQASSSTSYDNCSISQSEELVHRKAGRMAVLRLWDVVRDGEICDKCWRHREAWAIECGVRGKKVRCLLYRGEFHYFKYAQNRSDASSRMTRLKDKDFTASF